MSATDTEIVCPGNAAGTGSKVPRTGAPTKAGAGAPMAAAGVSQTAVVTANGESTSAPRTRHDIIAIADIYQMPFFITSP
jgi:hypothetical protein